jgi:hypothetical protein
MTAEEFTTQLPPHDCQAEAGALGCILASESQAAELFDQLALDDFYDPRHQTAFRALKTLRTDAKPLDVVTLGQWLKDKDQTEVAGGLPYVTSLPDQTPSAANFPSFLETLKDRALRRATLRDATELSRLACDPGIPAAVLSNAARKCFEVYSAAANCKGLTIRKPSEFLAMQFDDSDIILGDRLLAMSQSLVIAAAGGSGKSRLILQLIAAIVAGRKFLHFDTAGSHLRHLVLQTENSNRRLQHDLSSLKLWLGDDWSKFDERVLIHAIENDSDSFVSLDSQDNTASLVEAVEDFRPDIIHVDPLNDFAVGDLNKDPDMRQTLQAISRVCRKGNPMRAIVVAHHALTGKSGAARATGFDRSSFARNSKALHAWTRGQINLAPVDEDSSGRLIVACGKCSNGQEFAPFAIRLNPETMIYECDPTVNIKEWEQSVAGTKSNTPLMPPERVKELCRGPMSKQELAKAIIEDCGCIRQSAYRYIQRAEQARKIHFNKEPERYTK